jgi:exodeoxyribonuclease V gamma subunit
MLNIVRSNRVESLLGGLARRISETPLSSPFDTELVVVPSPAMARWVNLQLARRHGVAANLEYPLPASFVWQLSRDLLDALPEQDPLNRDRLTWNIFAALPELIREPAFASLRRYLSEDQKGLKRFQLAERIADVLDRYQLYRPELVRGWEAGQGDDWQALLWRRLTAGIGHQHRVAVIDRLLETLAGTGPFPALPERVSLFAISSLPPLLVTVIHALAAHRDVDLYLHAPTDAFWADLISQKALARKRLERPNEADLWEVGNSLLASWGRQGQALQDLLLDHESPIAEIDAFAEPPADTLLDRLQRDIFTLRPIAEESERQEVEPDDSVQVHICHSPLRECQVLHDQLLCVLETDIDLRPEDILVMVPEISLYAPYIEAVFRKADEDARPFIPWNLSDISVKDEHPLVQVFLQLLALPESRFSQSEVLSYLDVPELAGHFGLDSEAVAQVKDWLACANLRWGLDADHKQRLGLPGVNENTWAQAEQRLFGGYALGETALFQGIAPIGSVEGANAEVLGRFWRLFSKLTDGARQLGSPRSAEDWQACIGDLMNDFFGEREDEDGRIQKIRDAAADLADQARGLNEVLAPDLVRNWLEQRLGAESRYGRYFSGGVTFCGMRPMRSLPFQVICVLGLQDQAFPRRDRPAELDRMRKDWHPSDPRKGDEDRYLLLETLLCARRRLYLSYVGRDIRKNTERQPSVLVRELLDYIDQQYLVVGGAESDKVSKRLTSVHPRQPFSPRNFVGRGAGGGDSYDNYWCEVANAVRQPPTREAVHVSGWREIRLPEAPERMREVALVQLDRFLRHPVKYFINSRLQVYLQEEEPEEDEEVFALDGLQSFLLKRRLIEDRLQGSMPSRRQLSAEGILPHGAFAELVFEQESEEVAPLVERLEAYMGARPEQVPVDIELDGDAGPHRLAGQVRGIFPELGLLRWKPSALKGADILSLWLAHLAWCATGGPGEKQGALYTTSERFAIRETLAPDLARSQLARCLAWYWEGVHRPLLVLPKASYAFAVKQHQGGRADPMNAARSGWNGNSFINIPGDKDDPYLQLVMRGVTGDPLENDGFATLAVEIYGQALSSGELQ